MLEDEGWGLGLRVPDYVEELRGGDLGFGDWGNRECGERGGARRRAPDKLENRGAGAAAERN